MFTTEYGSQFVWHANAYKRPMLYVRRKLLEEELTLNGPRTRSFPHHFPYHQQQHRHHRPTSILFQQSNEDESKEKDESGADIRKKDWDWDCLLSLPYNRMNTDTRGIKANFRPASIDVFQDLGICSSRSSANNGSSNVNPYMMSIYTRDFSSKK